MTGKWRVVLVADPNMQWRDEKLGRFVRDAEKKPVLKCISWKNTQNLPRMVAVGENELYEVQKLNEGTARSAFLPGNIVIQGNTNVYNVFTCMTC